MSATFTRRIKIMNEISALMTWLPAVSAGCGALAGGVGVYVAIKVDVAYAKYQAEKALEMARMAHDSAYDAHRRIDQVLGRS
jgi:hypothetical protein